MSLVARGTQSHALTSSNTAATISEDAGSGSDRGLVAFSYWRTNGGHTWDSVTYNGVALTSREIIQGGTQYRMQIWTLDGPATGTNDLVFTPTGGTGDAAGCVIGYCFMEDVDMAQWLIDIATAFETGNSNAAGASFKSVEDVAGVSGGFGLFVAGIRDGGGAPTATADALLGVLNGLDQGVSGAQFAVAQGNWTSDGGTDSPSVDWDNDGGDLERRFAMVFEATGGGGLAVPVAMHHLNQMRQ